MDIREISDGQTLSDLTTTNETSDGKPYELQYSTTVYNSFVLSALGSGRKPEKRGVYFDKDFVREAKRQERRQQRTPPSHRKRGIESREIRHHAEYRRMEKNRARKEAFELAEELGLIDGHYFKQEDYDRFFRKDPTRKVIKNKSKGSSSQKEKST